MGILGIHLFSLPVFIKLAEASLSESSAPRPLSDGMNALLTARRVEKGAEEDGRMPVQRTWKAYLREGGQCSARGPSGPEDTNAGEESDQLGDISFETTSKVKDDSEPKLGKASFEPYHFFILSALPSALAGAEPSLPRPPLARLDRGSTAVAHTLPPLPYQSKALRFPRRKRLGLKLSLHEARGSFTRLLFEVGWPEASLAYYLK
jgi:hypothetical protein